MNFKAVFIVHSQEEKLIAYAQQQREECAMNEERQLLEKVAELFASSNARKKKLVQTAINGLRESASNRTDRLKQEMSTMHDSTSSVKDEWTMYMEKAESYYLEDTVSVENSKKEMEVVLQSCLQKAKMGAQQWNDAQRSLLNLEEVNVASVHEIVREGLSANQALRVQFSSGVSSALEDAESASKNLLSSIDHSLQLDRDACENLDSMIVPCCGQLRELNTGHLHKVAEIREYTGKCLSEEYTVDEPSCSTPKKRLFNLPSIGSIEELQTPAFEELLKSSRQPNGDVKHAVEAAQTLRDSRTPLTAINGVA